MASRSVELAVFWLPLLAGILLSGIAGSAWYGGDKIPAIWIAFFGVVCLLLTAALQIQNFAYANLLQPVSKHRPNEQF
jgi:TRAP-type C4-dicarboxylate transport system permease small subunit